MTQSLAKLREERAPFKVELVRQAAKYSAAKTVTLTRYYFTKGAAHSRYAYGGWYGDYKMFERQKDGSWMLVESQENGFVTQH